VVVAVVVMVLAAAEVAVVMAKFVEDAIMSYFRLVSDFP
jgi:hypothetical protein